jgi:hypothetical protein
MNHITEDQIESKSRAKKMLAELKRKEKNITFHVRQINKNTIVYCKNADRLDDFYNSYHNIKTLE